MKVCEKVESKGRTTYNEVADELVAEFALPNNDGTSPDQVCVSSIVSTLERVQYSL
jgi:hypothetical protein